MDLADHRVARVLAVVEAAAGQRPQLVGGDLGESRLSRIWSSRRITAYAATRCRFGVLAIGAKPSRDRRPGPQVGWTAERGTASSGSAAARSRRVPAEVRGVPRRPLARQRAGARAAAAAPRARRAGGGRAARVGSHEVGVGRPPCSGAPNRTSTSRPRVRSGRGSGASSVRFCRQSRCPPQTRDRHQRRAGLAGQRRRAGHQRAHDVRRARSRPRGRRRRPRPRAAGARARRYAAAGASRSTGTCRMRVHRPAATGDVPHVVRGSGTAPGAAWRAGRRRRRGSRGRRRGCGQHHRAARRAGARPPRPRTAQVERAEAATLPSRDRGAVRLALDGTARAVRRTAGGGRTASERRPAQRHTRAARSRSSSVTRLPIQRSASVISQSERMPAGPSVGQQPRHGDQPGQPAGDRERLAVVLAQQRRPGRRRGRGRPLGQQLGDQPAGLEAVVDALAVERVDAARRRRRSAPSWARRRC